MCICHVFQLKLKHLLTYLNRHSRLIYRFFLSSVAASRSKKSAVAPKRGSCLGVYLVQQTTSFMLRYLNISICWACNTHQVLVRRRTIPLHCERCELYFILFSKIYCIMAMLYYTRGSAIAEGPRDALVSRNSEVQQVSSAILLGVTLCDTLSFTTHVENLSLIHISEPTRPY